MQDTVKVDGQCIPEVELLMWRHRPYYTCCLHSPRLCLFFAEVIAETYVHRRRTVEYMYILWGDFPRRYTNGNTVTILAGLTLRGATERINCDPKQQVTRWRRTRKLGRKAGLFL